MSRDEFVRREMELFVREHDPQASISCIDEIVLSYMVSVLESLGSQQASDDDAFDVEDFTQMMDAYLPAIAQIDSAVVSDWMFALANKLSTFDEATHNGFANHTIPQSEVTANVTSDFQQGQLESQLAADKTCRQRTVSNQSSTSVESQGQSRSRKSSSSLGGQRSRSRKNSSRTSSTSETECQPNGDLCASAGEESAEDEEHIRLLLEMFPAACALEATHCVAVCGGELEAAAQLMLHRQETGESITQAAARHKKSRPRKVLPEAIGDSDVKKHIVAKYSYVDVDDDKKEHKPVLKPQGSKKLVRYLDGRVVSTRGEKFTEVKKEEDEEKMKKTYVNLKPARKYRFH